MVDKSAWYITAVRVPKDHPMVNQALSQLGHDFEALYAKEGAPQSPGEVAASLAAASVAHHPQ